MKKTLLIIISIIVGISVIIGALVFAGCGGGSDSTDDNTIKEVIAKDDIAINYYLKYNNNCFSIPIISQDGVGYDLDKVVYFDKPNSANPIEFDDDLILQSFYNHNVLSTKKLKTSDGKIFDLDGGFKIYFKFNYYNNPADELKDVYIDYFDTFQTTEYLRTVYEKKSKNPNYYIYEVIDFSESYIEISKLVGDEYVTVGAIDSTEKWNLVLKEKEIIMSDKNDNFFFESGKYRILFKSSVSWFLRSTANGKIYNANYAECFPYGHINDQYDCFYINVTGETYNTLIPNDIDKDGMFYQISLEDATTPKPFIKSGENYKTSDNKIKINIATILQNKDGKYYYNDKKLLSWTFSIGLYDADSDSYIENETINLLEMIVDNGIRLERQKDFNILGNCRFRVEYSLSDGKDGQTVQTDKYYMCIGT